MSDDVSFGLSGFSFRNAIITQVDGLDTTLARCDDTGGKCWGFWGSIMATTKATLVASGIASIEAALDKLERELENAKGSRKLMLEKWVAAVHLALRKHQRHTLH